MSSVFHDTLYLATVLAANSSKDGTSEVGVCV